MPPCPPPHICVEIYPRFKCSRARSRMAAIFRPQNGQFGTWPRAVAAPQQSYRISPVSESKLVGGSYSSRNCSTAASRPVEVRLPPVRKSVSRVSARRISGKAPSTAAVRRTRLMPRIRANWSSACVSTACSRDSGIVFSATMSRSSHD